MRRAVLTGLEQRARSSTPRRGNRGIFGFDMGIYCEEFLVTVHENWDCKIWPHEYPGRDCRRRLPLWQPVCMYITHFSASRFSHRSQRLVLGHDPFCATYSIGSLRTHRPLSCTLACLFLGRRFYLTSIATLLANTARSKRAIIVR